MLYRALQCMRVRDGTASGARIWRPDRVSPEYFKGGYQTGSPNNRDSNKPRGGTATAILTPGHFCSPIPSVEDMERAVAALAVRHRYTGSIYEKPNNWLSRTLVPILS